MESKYDTKKLNCTTTEHAREKEAEYHQANLGAPLRGKYKRGGKEYAKGGPSSINTGKANRKSGHGTTKLVTVTHARVVDGRTGKARMVRL